MENRRFNIVLAGVFAVLVSASAAFAVNGWEVNNAAALDGNFGLEITLDSDTPANVFVQDDTPANEVVYRAVFKINSNTFVGAPQPLNKHALFKARDLDGPINSHLTILLRQLGGVLVAAVKIIDDTNPTGIFRASNGQAFETNIPIAVTTELTIEFQQASGPGANDGIVRLFKNGVLRREHIGLDNESTDVDRVQWGGIGVRTGAVPSGSYYLDTFSSFRTLAP